MKRDILAANLGNFVAACLFGGAVVATRVAVRAVPPLSLAFLRYSIGGLILLIGLFVGARAALRFHWRDLPLLALLGFILFALFPWSFNAGLQRTEASRGSLMLATAPLWTAVLARASRGERLTRRQLLGLLLTFAGVVVVLSERGLHWAGNARTFAGDGLLLLSALCGALYAVLARRAFARYNALVVTSYTMVIGAVLLLPAALGEGLLPAVTHLNGTTAWLILYLAIPAGAIGWAAFVFALTRLTPTQATVYVNLNPLAATVLAALLLGERLTLAFVAGFVVVLAGVVLVNWPAPTKAAPIGDVQFSPST